MVLHKNIKILSWFNFFTDFKLYSPVAIIYFAQVTGSYVLGMSVFSLVQLFSALFEVPTGIFSDIIGRKKTVTLGALSILLAIVLYAIGGSFKMLAIGAIFEGLSRAFYSGNNNALLYDTLKGSKQESEYHSFLGKVGSMFQIALAISAILGSIIANWSFAWVIWLSVIPQLICLLLSFKIIEPASYSKESGNIFLHTKEAVKHFINNRKLRLISLSSIIAYALGEASWQFRAAFINTLWPLWAVGISKALSNVGSAFSYYFSGKLINKYKELKILITSNLYNRFINISMLAFPTVISPAVMSTTSLWHGVSVVAEDNLMQKEFTQKQRATMSSLNSLAGSILFAIVAFLIGLTADNLGPAKTLVIVQFILFINIVFYRKIFKEDKKN